MSASKDLQAVSWDTSGRGRCAGNASIRDREPPLCRMGRAPNQRAAVIFSGQLVIEPRGGFRLTGEASQAGRSPAATCYCRMRRALDLHVNRDRGLRGGRVAVSRLRVSRSSRRPTGMGASSRMGPRRTWRRSGPDNLPAHATAIALRTRRRLVAIATETDRMTWRVSGAAASD